MKRISLFLSILSIFVCSALLARDFYVSPSGRNSNFGTLSAPFKDLSFAITKARAGDTIFMRGGTHFVGEVYVDRKKGYGGREGLYLTIKAYENEAPILQGVSRRFIVWASFVRIEGLNIVFRTGSEPKGGWYLDIFGVGNQVVNCTFSGGQPKFGAILSGGNNGLYEGNVITIQAGGNTRDHGIYIKSGTGSIIRNNTITGSQGYGIHIFEDGSNGNLIKDLTISGNTVKGSRTRSGLILATQNNAKIEGVSITGNRFENNQDFGVLVRQGRDIDVSNNVFVNDKLRIEAGVVNFTESGNTFNGIEPPTGEKFFITTESPLPTGKVGEPYTPIGITVEGGGLPFTYLSRNLPDGLFFNLGVISGNPNQAGSFTDIEIGIREVSERVARKIFSIQITGEVEPPPTPTTGDTLEIDLPKVEKVLIIMKKE